MNVIEQSIRGKLEEAGYTSISKLPNRRDLAEWKLVKDDCGLANHEMLEVMNAVFPKDAAPAQAGLHANVGNVVQHPAQVPQNTYIDPSTADPTIVSRLVASMFTVVKKGVPPVVVEQNRQLFKPIEWPPNSDEDTKVTLAITHLATELPKFKATLFDQFRMADIHTRTGFLSGFITPTLKVRGTADAVITAEEVAGDIVSLAIGALVVFEFKTCANYAESFTQLVVELLGVRMASNKPVLAILSDLATGAIALRICVDEGDDNTFYLERTELTLSEMATLLVQFLKPSLAQATHQMKDDSEDADERVTSMFLKRRRVGGIAAVQDQLAMFFDLTQDPELEVAFWFRVCTSRN